MNKPKLYLIPCPIAEETAQRVLPQEVITAVLACKFFLVENVRTARRFISGLKLGIDINSLTFELLTQDSKRQEIIPFFDHIKKGENIGVISEAGCPGVADPGALAVEIAHQLEIEVVPLVGPSSILLALMGSGMNGQSFAFNGYIPIKNPERDIFIKKLETLALKNNQAQLFIETPYRNENIFAGLLQSLQKSTKLCVALNLSAENQYIKTKTVQDWAKTKVDFHKNPCIFIIGK